MDKAEGRTDAVGPVVVTAGREIGALPVGRIQVQQPTAAGVKPLSQKH